MAARRRRAIASPRDHRRPTTCRATASSPLPGSSPATGSAQPRGLSLPRHLRRLRDRHGADARREAARSVRAELAQGQPRLRALEEPDAVRRADDRVDDREGGGGRERAAADRGGDLQPAAPADAARDRRDDSLRRSASRAPSDHEGGSPQPDAVQHAQLHRGLPPGPIANPGLASMQAAAHPAKVDYLYFVAQARLPHHFFTASFADVRGLQGRARVRMMLRADALVGLIGNPVEHSLSPAMQNAAFAARGLDWALPAAARRGRPRGGRGARARRRSASSART